MKEPEKVPVGIGLYGWPFANAGVKYIDLIDQPAKAAAEYLKILTDNAIDCYWVAGVAQPVKAYDILWNNHCAFNDDVT